MYTLFRCGTRNSACSASANIRMIMSGGHGHADRVSDKDIPGSLRVVSRHNTDAMERDFFYAHMDSFVSRFRPGSYTIAGLFSGSQCAETEILRQRSGIFQSGKVP